MKESCIILFAFVLGIALGQKEFIPLYIVNSGANVWAVYLMLFAVGMGMGFDVSAWKILGELKGKILLVPVLISLGTLLGGILAWLILRDMLLRDVLAVGSGLGYYSLSSMILTTLSGTSLGSTALLANMIRELIALVFAPLLYRYIGGLAPLSAAGATSDTCLPIIAKYCGERTAIIAIFSGAVLTACVPVYISLLFKFFS